jgi:biuret amidohydrolase
MKVRTEIVQKHIAAEPYPGPYTDDLTPRKMALIAIGKQTVFCGAGGFFGAVSNSSGLVRQLP